VPDHHRVDVDHRPVGFGQCRGESLDQPQRAENRQFDGIPDVLESGVGQWLHRRHPEGVVDQDIDLAVGLHAAGDQIVDLFVIGDVGGDRHSATPETGHQGGNLLQTPGGTGCEYQVGSRLGTPTRQGGAECRSDSADHHDFVLKHARHRLSHHSVLNLFLP
jgi:hypothetical protein